MDFKPIATGFWFLEAPRADDRGVWFTECSMGGVRRLRPDGQVDSWLPERKSIGGLALNADGRVICSGPGGLVWLDPTTGATGVLLDQLEGGPLPGVNDVQPDGKGGLYFGVIDHQRLRAGNPGGSAICRLDRDGAVTKLVGDLTICNGIGLSPDGKRLYHNESTVGTIAYDIGPDGSLSGGEMLWQMSDVDGLAVDALGRIWIASTGVGAITRLTPDGRIDWQAEVPGATSISFGGADLKDVYVTTSSHAAIEVVLAGGVPETADGTLFHARAEVPGLPTAQTQLELPATG
jgi:sugar lactone lactonase YvrE